MRTTVLALAAALLATGLAGAPAADAAATPYADAHGRLVPHAAHGRIAVDRLGDDLPAAAALNGMSTRGLERLLSHDQTAWVRPSGRIAYVDPAPASADAAYSSTAAAALPYDQTFRLHSRPRSSRTIYLDFDGHTVAGTEFNRDPDWLLSEQAYPAFSLDGDPSSFSAAEQDTIQSVWARVSEDYAPFDVDVTTEDPGLEALRRSSTSDAVFGTRALITPSDLAANTLCGGQCGGIAFLGTFAESGSDAFQPAWVFPQKLGYDTKAIAEAVSHEVGHNLGLDHDGLVGGPGYYKGQGAWAPIMGVGYDRPLSQWSAGEYSGADNTQDDLAIITSNGVSYVADDHADTVSGATEITTGTASGVISTRSDRDVFAFPRSCDGPVTISVEPATTAPDLDARLRILSASGAELASVDPTSAMSSYDVASGIGATAQVEAAAGTTVYAEVDGVGAGSPATNGYSDYASLGRYTIRSTSCAPSQPAVVGFQSTSQSVAESGGVGDLVVTRTGNLSTPASVRYAVSGGSATAGSDYTLAPGTLSFAAGQTSKAIPVAILDDTEDETDETVRVSLSAPSTGTQLGALATTTLTITDDDAPVAPAVVGLDDDTISVHEDAGTLHLAVRRTGNTAVTASVGYAAVAGTAQGADFVAGAGRLVFGPGETTRTIDLSVVDDDLAEGEEELALVLTSPATGTSLGRARTTVVIGPSDQQPDVLISTRKAGGYVGEHVYGSAQSVRASARKGRLRSFFVRVLNDGSTASTVTITGSRAAPGSRLRYGNGLDDVTALLTSSVGGPVELAPGEVVLIRVDVRIGRRARVGSTKSVAITASWTGDGVRSDTVVGSVRVKRR